MKKSIVCQLLGYSALLVISTSAYAQAQPVAPAAAATPVLWHGKDRPLRYRPEGENFLIENGKLRFNRALYGSNTAFRAEAGDLPEFALYLPGMGGNLKFGLVKGSSEKWLIDARSVKARYVPGSMTYEITDPLLEKGTLFLTVIPLYEGEGLIVKAEGQNLPAGLKVVSVFGGATGKKFSRDGDIGADPESSWYLKPENCSDNIFKIDKNAFTLFYGSKKPLSEAERYEIQHLPQQKSDSSGEKVALKTLTGLFPAEAQLKLSDAGRQESPSQLYSSTAGKAPVLSAQAELSSGRPLYFLIQNPSAAGAPASTDVAQLFARAEAARKGLAERIKVETPDPFINTLGGSLAMAADGIWEDPSYLHGAVAWRMRLNAWRGAYVADPLGWHDRARRHFSSYALSQVTSPASGPVVADTALHLARQLEKMGTSLFSSGYISRNPGGDQRPHHYDMNLVFIDQLLNHFYWTGDTAYVRQMWPVLKRHLDWEKRNFDQDGDGLFDAYACIWASDAIQYSGGGVAHSSAYNYRAFQTAAELAPLVGENAEPYRKEADKILKAMNSRLWLKDGWYAEYQDLLGKKLVHPAAGLWTVYHTIDSRVPNPFQAYQMLRYVDNEIPHIPIRPKGLSDTGLYLLSTTNWQPYTWSVNNVVLAELLHTALAYWQGGRPEEAYRIWKSALIESQYMSSAPGNFEQLSFYDAIRGELYRDFADPVGMAGRSLVEGLFGIFPDALHDTLLVKPGFPSSWDHASLKTPDFDFSFNRKGDKDTYHLTSRFAQPLKVQFRLKALKDGVEAVLVNGKKVAWTPVESAVGQPELQFVAQGGKDFEITIAWKGNPILKTNLQPSYVQGGTLNLAVEGASVGEVNDPQAVLRNVKKASHRLSATVAGGTGAKTVFVKMAQGGFRWWAPLDFTVTKAVEMKAAENGNGLRLLVQNRLTTPVQGKLVVESSGKTFPVTIAAGATGQGIEIPETALVTGSNRIRLEAGGKILADTLVQSWNSRNAGSTRYEKVDLTRVFNDKVTSIFKNQYLSPRPASPTLQLPTQGIGNWCYPMASANIDDAGLRSRAGAKNEIVLQSGIPMATPGNAADRNILYTSLWDNYPDSARVPLSGKASHAYFLMAGSTNPMQTRLTNGQVTVFYKDGSSEVMELRNPESWWPIEEDYYEDGFAFTTGRPRPVRLYLKTGEDSRTYDKYTTIKGFTNMAVDGGAATLLDLPLNKQKELSHLVLKTIANDVVIGLMSVTLVR